MVSSNTRLNIRPTVYRPQDTTNFGLSPAIRTLMENAARSQAKQAWIRPEKLRETGREQGTLGTNWMEPARAAKVGRYEISGRDGEPELEMDPDASEAA